MAWGRKEELVPPTIPAKPEERPDKIISEMLVAYQNHFYETAKGQPDPSIEAANAKVQRANEIISSSRIGYSVCSLLEHVKHWDAWSKRDDFPTLTAFLVGDVRAIRDRTEKEKDRRTVHFQYSGVPYTLIFIENGVSAWEEDFNTYGSVELYASEELVVGLDIARDISKDYDRWSFHSVSAFAPGEWMKHVVEMSALIDAHQSRQMASFVDQDALRRAARIKL
jgi:hypothetical protein